MINRHAIRVTSDGVGGHVQLDGVDISDGVYGITLKFKAGHLPNLELELPMIQTETDANVIILDKTRDLLIQLGWTPPAERIITDEEPMRA